MNLTETGRILEQLHDVYGRSLPMGDTTASVWYKALGIYPADNVQAAVYAWVADNAKAPRPSDLREAIRSSHRADEYDRRVIAKPVCGVCEDGWIEIDPHDRGNVTRCPNGCLPAGMGERVDFRDETTAAPDWPARVRDTLSQLKRRQVQIGERGYLLERGYSPDEYQVKQAMILWRTPLDREKKPDCPRCGGTRIIEISEDFVEDCSVCVPVVS